MLIKAISFVQKLGFKCEAYVDGVKTIEGLERASENGRPFHLILMDCQMPSCDGYEATRRIRNHPDPTIRNLLIIAMTASAIQGDREKCLEAGMNNYLAKPVRAQTLKALLESYLEQKTEEIPGLEKEARELAREVLADSTDKEKEDGKVEKDGGYGGERPERPRSVRMDTTQRWRPENKEGGSEDGKAG